LPEEGSLLPQHTIIDICSYYGALKLMDEEKVQKRLIQYLKKFNIESYLNVKANTLSKGNRQKIQFIVSILHDPDLIILDEPFSGLDPVSVEYFKNTILELKAKGKTIIFSSHIMSHVEMLCEQIVIINTGKVVLEGNLDEIKQKVEKLSDEDYQEMVNNTKSIADDLHN
jgi:ABC-2 type transport system ATP-binding protein